MRQKLLNERAKFILCDEWKIRLQSGGENFMGFDPPVILLEAGIATESSGSDCYLYGKLGVKGCFWARRNFFGMIEFSGNGIFGFRVDNPGKEIYEAILHTPLYGFKGAEYFGIYIEKSYWPKLEPLMV